MKHLHLLKGWLIVLLAFCAVPSWAYDFEVDDFCYNIKSQQNLECWVADWLGSAAEVAIPETVTYDNREYTVTGIELDAFFYDNNVTEVIIPNTVTNVDGYAFNGCRNLTTVIFPNSVKSIRYSAIAGCPNLRYVVIGKNAVIDSDHDYTLVLEAPDNCEIFNLSPHISRDKVSDGGNIYDRNNCITFQKSERTYDGTIPDVEYTNNLKGWNLTLTPNEALTAEGGTHEVTYTATFTDGTITATFDDVPYTYEINKASLTATVDDKQKTYGDANPALTYRLSGFVNGENADVLDAVDITTPATASSDAGEYPITLTVTDNNYELAAPTAGTLTVTKAPLTVRVADASRTYGDPNPEPAYVFTGLRNGDAAPTMTEGFMLQTEATPTSTVGSYDMHLTGGEATNYTFTQYISGTLTVTKAPLEVAFQSLTRTYGDPNPAFVLTYNGLKNNETPDEAFTLMPTVSTQADALSPAGTYTATPGDGEATNYTLSYTPGTVTVEKAPLIVRADNATREYGAENPAFTFTYTGFKNHETAEVLIVPPTATTVDMVAHAGTYDITPSGAEAFNYAFTYENGTLTVTKAPLAVTAEDATKIYGEELPHFNLTYDGFRNGDTPSCFDEQPEVKTSATTQSDVGIYPILVSGGASRDYDFATYTAGTLTIEKADQNIYWPADLSRVEMGQQVELTAETSSGLAITYTVSDETVASVYTVGRRQFLDCKAGGFVTVTASQAGDKNHYAAPKVVKNVFVIDVVGIDKTVTAPEGEPFIFTPDGRRLTSLQKGVNILRYANGQTRKVYVK